MDFDMDFDNTLSLYDIVYEYCANNGIVIDDPRSVIDYVLAIINYAEQLKGCE